MKLQKFTHLVVAILVLAAALIIYFQIQHYINENKILKKVIGRLEADSRIAEVLVTGVNLDEETGKLHTTIKFLEYDIDAKPLEPRYFTFAGNIIQFQSLVIRFDDIHIRNADKLKGKSAYLFWKVFMLDGSDTTEHEITQMSRIPQGYKVKGSNDSFEEKLWKQFWEYALNPDRAKSMGIKNAQLEAPGTMFIPGVIYTIKIEHDGGIRIDSAPIPNILRGERIPR